MIFIDIKRAHFVSKATREICVELHPELQQAGKDLVGLLRQSMYGFRDAGRNCELEIARVMCQILGFEQGLSSPCNFWHKERNIRVTVHRDDFEGLAPYHQLMWFADELPKQWSIVVRGILGPPGTPGTVQEVRHLNRIDP